MAKDSDLEERTVFAEPEEGGTVAVEVKTDPDSTMSVRNERNTVPENEQLVARTGYAAEGVRVAVLFAHKFGRRVLGTRAHLSVRLNEPGVSTESGTKARQAIVLVPKTKGRGTTTIGWLDPARCIAELKSFALLAEQHRSRNRGEEVDVGREEYEALLGDMELFLRGSGITPTIAEVPSAVAKAVHDGPKKSGELQLTTRMIVGIISLILLIGVGIGVIASKSCDDEVEEVRFEDAPKEQTLPLKRRVSPFQPR